MRLVNRADALARVVCLVGLLLSVVTEGASANSTVQSAFDSLYGRSPACAECHSATPEDWNNATGPLSSSVAPTLKFTTGPANVGDTGTVNDLAGTITALRNAVNAIYAPRFSSSTATISSFNKATGSGSVTLANGGAFAFRGSSGAHAPSVTIDNSDFVLGTTGLSRTLNRAGGNPFSNTFGNVTVTASSVSQDNLTHSTLSSQTITVELVNALPTLATSTYPIARAGTLKTQALDVTNPDGDTLEFELRTINPGDGISVDAATGTISVTAPDPMPSSYSKSLTVRIRDASDPDKATQFTDANFTITAEPGSNNPPAATTASFSVAEGASQSGIIASDADNNVLSFTRSGNLVDKGVGIDLGLGTITVKTDNTFTYVAKSDDPTGTDTFQYTVSDGIAPAVSGTLTFTKTAVDDNPTVKAGSFVKTVNIEPKDPPQKNTTIDLKEYVQDPDTPINQLLFRVLSIRDAEGAVSTPATFGTFTPTLPDVINNGVFVYRNRDKVALDFIVQFRVGPPGAPPSSAACAASDPDCGEVNIQVFLNSRGRHSPSERLELAASLGKTYQTIPGGVGHFPNVQSDGACLNCHIAGKVTSAAPSCGNRQFFNELGRRLCLIRPFQTPFNSRVVDAVTGKVQGKQLESFEPTVTLSQSVIDVSDAIAVGKTVSAPMQFGVGLDLDGKKSRILRAYIPDATARNFFDIKITNNGGASGTATGVLVVKKKLSEYSGRGQIQVQPLPVNFGAVRTNQSGSIDANGEGFYPFHTDQGKTLRINVIRSLPKVADDSYQTNIDPVPFVMEVTANDKGGGAIDKLQVVTQPGKGTVSVKGKTLVFVANGATGADSFTYRAIRTGVGPSETNATVALQIFDADDAVAQPDSYRTVVGETELLPVLENDRGPTPDSFKLVAGKLPKLGSARFVGNKLEYKALKDGTDVFAYEVTGGGVTTQANVTVRVGKVNGDVLAAATNRPELKSVAKALGDTCAEIAGAQGSSQQDLGRICDGLADDAAANRSIDAALEAIRNEEVLVAGDSTLQHDRLAASNLFARLDAVRGGGARGASFSQFNLQIDGQTLPGSAVDAMIEKASVDGPAPKGDLPWGVFVAGTVTIATKDSSDREAGFDLNGIMMTAGADYALSDRALLGLAVSLGRSSSEFDSGGELETSTAQLATYGSFDLGSGLSIDGFGGLAFNDFDMSREIAFGSGAGAVNRTAIGTFDGEMLSAALRLKYATQLGSASLEAYGGFSYAAIWTDAYTESGAQGLSLAVGEQEFDTLAATVGFRLSDAIVMDSAVFKPYIGVSYSRQLDSDKRSVSSRFVAGGAAAPEFIVTTESDGENTGTVELGFSADLANHSSITADISGSFSDDGLQAYQLKAGISIPLWRPEDEPEAVADAPVPRRKKSQQPTTANPPDDPAPDGGTDGPSDGGGQSAPGGGGWGG